MTIGLIFILFYDFDKLGGIAAHDGVRGHVLLLVPQASVDVDPLSFLPYFFDLMFDAAKQQKIRNLMVTQIAEIISNFTVFTKTIRHPRLCPNCGMSVIL